MAPFLNLGKGCFSTQTYYITIDQYKHQSPRAIASNTINMCETVFWRYWCMSGRHLHRYDQKEYSCDAKGTADCKLVISSYDNPMLATCTRCVELEKAEKERREKEKKEKEEAEGK